MKSNLYFSIILFTLFFSVLDKANAQTLNWSWAKSAGGALDDRGTGIAADASGNSYAIGYFKAATITFGSFTLTNVDPSGFSSDFYIVKHDMNGNVVWAKSAGSSGNDNCDVIALDASGNIYVSGVYRNSITLGSSTLTSVGSNDIFVAKYDNSGNVIWAVSAGGSSGESTNAIALDASGNIYITGQFNDADITFGSIVLTNAGDDDFFIVKYDNNGNGLWGKSAGSAFYESGVGITVDGSGNIYAIGSFESTSISFDSITFTNNNPIPSFADIFMVKYNSNGLLLWAKQYGGSNRDYLHDIASDTNANIYVTGNYNSTSITFDTITLSNQGDFLVKFDSSGSVIWGRELIDGSGKIKLDDTGNIYTTGSMSGTRTYGSSTLTTYGVSDILIVKFDNNGNALCAQHAGGTGYDFGQDIALDGSGNCYLTGYFRSPTATFGSTIFTNASSTVYDGDIFIAKLGAITGISEINNAQSLIGIYPNPAINYFTISLPGDFAKSNITITDITGKLIYTSTTNSTQKIEVNSKYFIPAIYFVQIQTPDFTETKKLVVTE